MTTETQLTDALFSLEQRAPTVAEMLDSLTLAPESRRPPSRSRRALLGAAAAAALVAAVMLGAVHHNRTPGAADAPTNSDAPLPSRAQLLPTWHFEVGGVPGYTVTRDRIQRVGPVTWVAQTADVVATRSRMTGVFSLADHSPGGYDSALASDRQLAAGLGRPVTIDGRSGYFSPGGKVNPTARSDAWSTAADANEQQPNLIWQLPDGTFGRLMGTFGFRAARFDYDNTVALRIMTTVARAVHYVAHQPVTMPFHLRRLPADLVPESMRSYSQPRAQCLGYGTGRGPYPTGSVGSVLTVCRAETFVWRTSSNAWQPTSDGVQSPFQSLLGSGRTLATRVLTDGTTMTVIASPAHPNAVSPSQAAQLANDADLSPDFTRPASWPAVR